MRLALLPALALTALAGCVAPPGSDFIAVNGLRVVPTGPGSFEVTQGPGIAEGEASFWCAAGDYVSRGLSKGPTTQIYRTTKPPQRGSASVSFSLDPKGAQPSGVIRVGNETVGFTAGAATGSFCMKVPPIPIFD